MPFSIQCFKSKNIIKNITYLQNGIDSKMPELSDQRAAEADRKTGS
jgi:hypothetical protein